MTFLGSYTVAEANDLAAKKSIDLAAIAAQRATLSGNVDSSWDSDWANMMANWNTAKNNIGPDPATVGASAGFSLLLPDDVQTAGNSYEALIRALQKTQGVVSPGDFQDLSDRLLAAQKAQGITHPQLDQSVAQQIQPNQNIDVDEQGIQDSTKFLKAVGANKSINPLAWIPTWAWVVAGTAVFGFGFLAVAPYVAVAKRTL
jgi:hypothetical protein